MIGKSSHKNLAQLQAELYLLKLDAYVYKTPFCKCSNIWLSLNMAVIRTL